MRRPFAKIEDSLEFIVERPFSMIFRRSVQPAEVGKRLKKELSAGAMVTVRGKVAPSDFLVRLEPGDATPYLDHANPLADDLADWLEEVAQAQGLTTMSSIRVRFEADETIRNGRFEINSRVQEVDETPVRYVDPGLTEPFEIADRQGVVPAGYVEICSGPSTGAVFPIRKHLNTVGRDLSNDLVIENPEVSRVHAELETVGGVLTITDRNSMNGTFVNGIRISGPRTVDSGDQIIFGTTICRFWRELL
jgi:hypothetical protein